MLCPECCFFLLLLTALLPYPLPADEPQTTLEHQNSSRKLHLHPPDLDQPGTPSPPRSSCHVSRCSDSERRRRSRRAVSEDEEVVTPDVSVAWQPVCRLVEEGLRSTRDGADVVVVAEIECGVLDHLVRETVDELLRGASGTARAQRRSVLSHSDPSRRHSWVARTFGQDEREVRFVCCETLKCDTSLV